MRMQEKREKSFKNQGFSLIELLISIIILAIVMVPLLNNFITAAKINQKMAKIRSVEVTSESLLEGLKYMKIEEILHQFALDDHDNLEGMKEFSLLPLVVDNHYYAQELIRLDPKDNNLAFAGSNTEEISEDGEYTLSIVGMEIASNLYDVLVHINSKAYTEGEEGVTEETTYNEYELPVITELDSKAVAMLDVQKKINGMDADTYALMEFLSRNEAYVNEVKQRNQALLDEYHQKLALYEEELAQGGNPEPVKPIELTPEPTALTEEIIKQNMSKQIEVTVLPSGDRYRIVGYATYQVSDALPIRGSADIEDQRLQVKLLDESYKNPISYLYIFYTPSLFTMNEELIQLSNKQGDAYPLNTYVMKQTVTTSATMPYFKLKKESGSYDISIYSNMNYSEGSELQREFTLDGFRETDLKGTIEKKPPSDWIYEIDVSVYEHEADRMDRYQNLVYSISSTGVDR